MLISSPALMLKEINRRAGDSMSLRQRQPRIKLDPEAYSSVQKLVLERDGWRCQECGAAKNLQVHHLKPRNQLGSDIEQILITLCVSCHGKSTEGKDDDIRKQPELFFRMG